MDPEKNKHDTVLSFGFVRIYYDINYKLVCMGSCIASSTLYFPVGWFVEKIKFRKKKI